MLAVETQLKRPLEAKAHQAAESVSLVEYKTHSAEAIGALQTALNEGPSRSEHKTKLEFLAYEARPLALGQAVKCLMSQQGPSGKHEFNASGPLQSANAESGQGGTSWSAATASAQPFINAIGQVVTRVLQASAATCHLFRTPIPFRNKDLTNQPLCPRGVPPRTSLHAEDE